MPLYAIFTPEEKPGTPPLPRPPALDRVLCAIRMELKRIADVLEKAG